MQDSLARALVLSGLAIAALGGVIWLLPRAPWLGRLPGDVRLERPGFTFYAPIATSLLLSLVLTLVLNLLLRRR